MIAAVIGFAIGWVIHSALRRWVGETRVDLIWVVLCLGGLAWSVIQHSWAASVCWGGLVLVMLWTMHHSATCERCSS